MAKEISAAALHEALEADGDNIALIDVRETAEYNLAHIAGSCSVPRRQVEFRIEGLVPRRGARVVMCDDDGRRAGLAARTLESHGYTDVSVLAGGLNRWVTDGLQTEWGVNVPSKDFGEKVLLQQGVPEVEPDELARWIAEKRKLIILDSRTPEEHQRSCIPGSRSMPGAELGLRVWELIDADPDADVVVHCAGRTRSIIGAGTLHRLGVPNVYALKNGTMGWLLAGLELETGSDRLTMPQPSPANLARSRKLARQVAEREGVRFVDVKGATELLGRAGEETLYPIDVRTAEEYAAGHLPGFRWVPGGQAVQATDNYVAVRGVAILFVDDETVRACMTASWFSQMGYRNVHVLEGGVSAWRSAGLEIETGMPSEAPLGFAEALEEVTLVTPAEVSEEAGRDGPADALAGEVVFVGTSEEFSRAHVPWSHWLSRSWLELRIGELSPPEAPLLVTCADGTNSVLAAAALQRMGYRQVRALEGGVDAWRRAGLAAGSGLAGVTQPPDDVLPARRSFAEMLNYLRWEEELGHKYAPSASEGPAR